MPMPMDYLDFQDYLDVLKPFNQSVKAICNLQQAQPHHQSLSIISDASVDPSFSSQKLVDVKAEQRRDRFIKD